MVECEYDCRKNTRIAERVLIDTWWNVNYGIGRDVVVYQLVLIDTWWNVNQGKQRRF